VTREGPTPSDVFSSRFGGAATHVARAPGRVNLIGEHIDYNDLPVLPMAIQREVRLVYRPREDGVVRVANVDPEFDPVEFEIGPSTPPGPAGNWGNYLKAPAVELARRSAISRGMEGVVSSSVPVASGLSSSTALLNALGLALAVVNEVSLAPMDFAQLMADAERYTGTRGGGMDQAISVGGRVGHAARIAFAPLRMRHIVVPGDWRFIVAHTGVRAEKSRHAREAYNQRRSECERALASVAERGLQSHLVPTAPQGYPDLLRMMGSQAAIAAATEVLPAPLLSRFRHVVSEAARVDQAADCLSRTDFSGFGALMDDSHCSLRTDYEVSSEELDDLVDIARDGGAAGARLTGAGFGGCIVALASSDTVDAVLAAIAEQYYQPRGMSDRLGDCLFVAAPSAGASVDAL